MVNRLQLSFLGPFRVSLDGRPVTGFESNKVRALLAYLAVENERPHSREALCGLLWPDWPQASALSSLRNALADLRKNLEDSAAQPPFLLVSRDSLQFNPGSDTSLDVAEFEKLIRDKPLSSGKDPQSTISNLQSAIFLYRGPFLEGFTLPENNPFEEWLMVERGRLQQEALGALRCLADLYERQGELEQALVYARQGLALEPWLEEEHQRVMRMLALSGQRSEALAQYVSCATLLTKELGVAPGDETRRLYEAIRDGTLEKWTGPAFRGVKEPPAPGPSPYKGLQFFDEADAGLFFGREALVAQLLERLTLEDPLTQRGPFDRFLAVIGASGSGKSSVVRAGLVPAVRRQVHWPVFVLTPTAHPLEALAACLTQGSESVTATATLIDDLAADPRGLHLFARKWAGPTGEGLLLIVDQFEELFSLCRVESERIAFIDNLLTAVCADGPVHLLVALRADFYAACAPYENLRQALGQRQAFIGPMTAAELRRAIEEPARLGKWDLEAGLVELFLRDLGAGGDGQAAEPGALPLLSHALLETWLRRQGRTLTLEGYAEAGGVKGSIARTAESVYGQLSPEEQAIARDIFLRLTELGEGAQQTRRRAGLAELAAGGDGEARKVLKTLADARLVITSVETAEVAHEAVIREWSRLQDWLNEDREGLRLHRRLTEAALEWESLGREASLLYRGARLAQALEWGQRHDSALNDLEREFLQASKTESEREAAEREAMRRRELEAAQKLLEEQARSARRLRKRAIYLAVAMLVASGLAVLAFGLYYKSIENSRLANARELSIASINTVKEDEDRGLLLALQAVKIKDLPETENALHQALWAVPQDLEPLDTLSGIDVVGAAVAPGGERLAIYRSNGNVQVWKLEDGSRKINRSLQLTIPNKMDHLTETVGGGYAEVIIPVVFDPDGSHLAVVSEGSTASLWDTESAEAVQRFTGHKGLVISLAFSPGGKFLATLSADFTVKIWDVETGEVIQTLSGPLFTNVPGAITFSQDGSLMAIGIYYGNTLIYKRTRSTSSSSNKPFEYITSIPGQDQMVAIAFSPDGKQLALRDSQWLKVYDITSISPATTPSLLTLIDCHDIFYPLALFYSPDGRSLIIGGMSAIAQIWDVISGERLTTTNRVGVGINSLTITKDGTRLIIGYDDNSVRVWDTSLVINKEWLAIPQISPYSRLSQDGKYLVSAFCDENPRMVISELVPPGLKQLNSIKLRREACGSIDINSDFSRLVMVVEQDEKQRIQWWDLKSGKILNSFFVKGYWKISEFDLSPDGLQLATSLNDDTTVLWNLESGELVRDWAEYSTTISDGAFNSDGTLLAAGGGSTIARIWNVSTGEIKLTFNGHNSTVLCASFSQDGEWLVTSGSDLTIRVWNARTGEERFQLPSTYPVKNAVFSPDGKYLATATINEIVTVWSTSTGRQILSVPGYRAFFTGDSKHFIAVENNETKTTGPGVGYTLDIEELIAIARSRLTRTWTLEECRQFLHRDTCPPTP